MFKNRFVLVLGVLSLLLVTVAVSKPFSNSLPVGVDGASDFYQRHPEWKWIVRNPSALIPVTGDTAFSDYYQRHLELSVSSVIGMGAPDYFQRHPELIAPVEAAFDQSDYFFRHPELRALGKSTDLTDYFVRHPELSAQ